MILPNRSWQVPPAEADEMYRLAWVNEACEDGANWNQSQPGYADWRKALEIINGTESKQDAERFRSQVSSRRLKTNVRTAIAGLANIRPIWGYHASKTHEKFAMMMNKTSRALYLEGFWDQNVKEVLAYAAATGTGYIRPVYKREQAGTGKGNIRLLTYGQPCVLPVQVPTNGDLQGAYAVTLMDEVPIFEAHSMFPMYQDKLLPTNSKYWYSSDVRGAAEKNSAKGRQWWNPFSKKDGDIRMSNLYIPIRYTTIIDLRINTSGFIVPMGQPGTPWYYEVPSLGEVKLDGNVATEEDARLYPYRRLIISSQNCIMYDGPAFNWHGQLDLIPFCVDKWPWAPTGFSMTHDSYVTEKTLTRLQRGMVDRAMAQNNLPLAYNIDAVTKLEAEQFDPLDPDNNRIGFDGSQVDKPFEMVVPSEWYRISGELIQMCQGLRDEMDYTMQIRDLVELSKSKVLGKDMDAVEKMLSSLGPIVKDIGRGMENSLGRVGYQVGYLILQYMTSARIMQYVGPESMVEEVFDYNPAELYPSHLPDETVHLENSQEVVPSKYTSMQRARWMADNLRFFIMPHSLHEVHQMTMVLMMMQMKQRGMQISDYSIMSAANIPDVVAPDGNSEQQRFQSEQKDKVIFQAEMAKLTQTIAGEQGLGGPIGPAPASSKKGGRPPSGQAAPKMEVKGDGRPIISESK